MKGSVDDSEAYHGGARAGCSCVFVTCTCMYMCVALLSSSSECHLRGLCHVLIVSLGVSSSSLLERPASVHVHLVNIHGIVVMQLTSQLDILGCLTSGNKSGRFYSDRRNKSSRETCVFSASTTVVR